MPINATRRADKRHTHTRVSFRCVAINAQPRSLVNHHELLGLTDAPREQELLGENEASFSAVRFGSNMCNFDSY